MNTDNLKSAGRSHAPRGHSVSPAAWDEEELLAEADRRELELEEGRARELSHEEFMAGLRRS